MPILATIVLDSGAFLQDIDSNPAALDIGYFQCAKDHSGNVVPDIHVYVDGNEATIPHSKLGKGTINVLHTKGSTTLTNLKFASSLTKHLLRKKDLYNSPVPNFDDAKLECKLHFNSGAFRCSMVKDRRFKEVPLMGGSPGEKHTKQIAHNTVVEYEVADDGDLRLEANGKTLFSTARDVTKSAKRVDIEIVSNNLTAEKFFREALDLTGQSSYWLPNQGDPPPMGAP
ncbi:MAG TPA: hypothetical protein VNN73_06110 [Blastocatellia bacterium]|nr:hypothetical protein [Blastocatellia bacterium]